MDFLNQKKRPEISAGVHCGHQAASSLQLVQQVPRLEKTWVVTYTWFFSVILTGKNVGKNTARKKVGPFWDGMSPSYHPSIDAFGGADGPSVLWRAIPDTWRRFQEISGTAILLK